MPLQRKYCSCTESLSSRGCLGASHQMFTNKPALRNALGIVESATLTTGDGSPPGRNPVTRPNRLMARLMAPIALRLGDMMIAVGDPRQSEPISQTLRRCPTLDDARCSTRGSNPSRTLLHAPGYLGPSDPHALFRGGGRLVLSAVRSADVVRGRGR